MTSNSIAFVCSTWGDSHQIGRLLSVRKYREVSKIYAYSRPYYPNRFLELDPVFVGHVVHGFYLKRLWLYFRALRIFRAELRRFEGDLVYVFGLDNLLLLKLASVGLGRRIKFVYEIDDILSVLSEKSITGVLLRAIASRIVPSCDLVVCTSEAFITEFYNKICRKRIPWILIENKINELNFLAAQTSSFRCHVRRDGCRMVIGYFGIIRCSKSLEILGNIAVSDRSIDIVIRGYIMESVADSFKAIQGEENVFFYGAYAAPIDLEKAYNELDIAWICYPYTGLAFSNSSWARTNRFYEAGYYGCPMIAAKCTKDGERILSLGSGVCIDMSDVKGSAEKLSRLKNSDILKFRDNLVSTSIDNFRITDEYLRLETRFGEMANPSKYKRLSVSGIRVCTSCVMDTTDSKISFDVNGVCDHCRTFYRNTLPNWNFESSGTETLRKLVKKIKAAGEGKEFDCILGMSGGVDSSYLTHLAKVELGLRPLIFHVDAGWNSQEAVNNIEKLVDGLSLDLYTEVIDWNEMRDLQLAYFKAGVPHIDSPQDLAFFATMYKFAHKHDVKYILTGANLSTECIRNPVEWVYYGDTMQLKDIHSKFGSIPLRSFPISPILWHKVYLPLFRGIRVVRPLNLMPFVKKDAMKLLVERYGWQPYPQKHFESRFTRFYEGFWLPGKFGYDTRKVQFSSLILTGQMSREEALEKLKTPPYDPVLMRQDFEYVAVKLGISASELQGYFDAPNKSYRDYKSQEVLFSFGSSVMKLFGLEIGGKR